jgi:hypothetical protein
MIQPVHDKLLHGLDGVVKLNVGQVTPDIAAAHLCRDELRTEGGSGCDAEQKVALQSCARRGNR